MNKNILIGLSAIIIVLGLTYTFTHPKEVAVPQEVATTTAIGSEVTSNSDESGAAGGTMLAGEVIPSTATITYTEDGFIPESVTIIEGSTVTFVNESDEKMWIGSDDHPTHTLYPAKSDSDCLGSSFDQCKAVEKGGEWSFTFDEVGTWGYHNHARARNSGTIVVQTEEEYLSTH